MDKTEVMGFSGTALIAGLTAIQYDEVMKWINLALACLTAVISIAYTIYKWWKKSKEDGKIDANEVGSLLHEIKDELDSTKGKLEDDNRTIDEDD